MIELREYQDRCVNAWFDAIVFKSCTPAIAVPTGGGKSYIQCGLIGKYLDMFPNASVLILSHTQDIVQQDYDSLLDFFPGSFMGVYSAGLGKKNIKKITVGGIQSVYRSPDKFKHFDLVIVDECHTINHKADGMYRTFFDAIKTKVTGMSATVFRTGHGYIYKGKGTLFDYLAFDLTSVKEFNKLVADGYLTKLISINSKMKMNTQGIRKQGGDYNQKQLSKKFDKESITLEAVNETIQYGQNYKKWLIFAIDIDHADHICKHLEEGGIDAEVLHSKMAKDRGSVVDNFKNRSTRCLVSVGMVTTGFDAPNVDLLVLLRPTMSAVLHVQMVGRGLRVAPGKTHCLVLDFAGNTARLGPINDVAIPKKAGGDGTGDAPTKNCPNCPTICYASARVCESCGHEFEFETKLTKQADDISDIVKWDESNKVEEEKIKWLKVVSTQSSIHRKAGLPDTLMVIYRCGLSTVKEWICFNHGGYAKRKADNWAQFRGYRGSLDTHSVFAARTTLRVPTKIQVDFSTKWPTVINAEFSTQNV